MIENLSETTTLEMTKAINHLNQQLAKIRTGRANPDILNGILVIVYETPTPINQVASITVPEGRQIRIVPFDKKTIGDIEMALNKANLGMLPVNDGESLRLNIPALTEESRKSFVRDVKSECEEAKVTVRGHRRHALDLVKKSDVNKDENKVLDDEVQKITDTFISKIDEIGKQKEIDVMTI